MVVGFINFRAVVATQAVKSCWGVVSGEESAAAYLSRAHPTYPTTYYPSAQFINTTLPESARVLVVGDARGYYLERPYILASIFDVHPLFHAANEVKDGKALFERLREAGISHLLMNVAEAARTNLQTGENLTPEGESALDGFWKNHLNLLFQDINRERTQDRFSAVYELVSDRSQVPGAPDVGPNYPLMIFQQRARVVKYRS